MLFNSFIILFHCSQHLWMPVLMKLLSPLQLYDLSSIPYSEWSQNEDGCYYPFQTGTRNNLQIAWYRSTICSRRERRRQSSYKLFQGFKVIFRYACVLCNYKLSQKCSGRGSNMSCLRSRRILVSQTFGEHGNYSQVLKNLWWWFHQISAARGIVPGSS